LNWSGKSFINASSSSRTKISSSAKREEKTKES
jgi:hypothetical protein